MAVIKNKTKVVSLLVKAGASLDIQDKVEVFSTILKITTTRKVFVGTLLYSRST